MDLRPLFRWLETEREDLAVYSVYLDDGRRGWECTAGNHFFQGATPGEALGRAAAALARMEVQTNA